MADRVHPGGDSPPATAPPAAATTTAATNSPTKPSPPPGTYVVQIPKDQIYRYPPPENAKRYQKYSRKNRRSCSFCCCLCWILSLLFLLALLLAATAGVLYLVFRPKALDYAIESISIKKFNLNSTANPSQLTTTISPEFNVTVRAHNPNSKIGVYYRGGSSVAVSYAGAELCAGALPAFYQPAKNVTVFKTVMVGEGIRLSRDAYLGLMGQQRTGEIPLGLDLKVPVRVKFGSVKTWTLTVKVGCDVAVDKLGVDASVVSNKCRVRALPWKSI
ncbi:hypothetical protein Sjap_001945 [Stephania japonica]|uniref:Late embryogenesis abundant protein LEA-2 subgroup domain-containing protein n=1 Tax=Stephania japonica TaxID=461633 RepID=A0AAP0PTQ9_9MAGN